MTLKIAYFKEADERDARVRMQIGRVWFIWFLGVIVGAIGIRPSGFSSGGLTLAFERPELVQGVIYLVCMLVAARGLFVYYTRSYRPFIDYRNLVWTALPRKRKTLRRLTVAERAAFKKRIREQARIFPILDLVAFAIPPAIILFYNHKKVFQAIQAIMSGTV